MIFAKFKLKNGNEYKVEYNNRHLNVLKSVGFSERDYIKYLLQQVKEEDNYECRKNRHKGKNSI